MEGQMDWQCGWIGLINGKTCGRVSGSMEELA
jgi:hypothetical protein